MRALLFQAKTSVAPLTLVLGTLSVFAHAPSPTFGDGLKRDRVLADDRPLEFYPPPDKDGGLWLAIAPVSTSDNQLGEPLNMIISGHSDADILIEGTKEGGLKNYFESLGFGEECFGLHIGDRQKANLGDGLGLRNETAVLRWNYGDPVQGTCKESLIGGNHLRYWRQNGSAANSQAVFAAVSYEFPLELHHDIVPDGYNLGRDLLVGNITGTPVVAPTIRAPELLTGQTSSKGYTYNTTIRYVFTRQTPQERTNGVNHADTVSVNGQPPVDGYYAVLTASIISRPPSSSVISSTSFTPSTSTTSETPSSTLPGNAQPKQALQFGATFLVILVACLVST